MFEETYRKWIHFLNLVRSRRVVFLLCIFEFLQKFAYHGFLGSLFLFLKHELRMELRTAIAIFHFYVGLSFILPLMGTLLADHHINKVLTLLIMTLFSIVGFIFMIFSAVVAAKTNVTVEYAFDHPVGYAMFGLILIAMGGGVLREVIVATCDAQFDQKDADDRQIRKIFHQVLHYCVVGGSLCGMILMPVLRMQTQCFETTYCYTIAFIIPMLFLVLAMCVLGVGYKYIQKTKPGLSAIIEMFACVQAALDNSHGGGKHWVDNASYRFIDEFLDDTRATLHVLALYIPLPLFWALYSQIGSRFVYLNTLFNGTVSFDRNMYVEPDHLQALNPLLMLICMPFYELYINPALRYMRCCFSTMKQRMFLGALLATLAFFVAGGIELHFAPKRNDLDMPQEKEGDLVIFNLRTVYEEPPVEITTNITGNERFKIKALDFKRVKKLPVVGSKPFTFAEGDRGPDDKCKGGAAKSEEQPLLYLVEKKLIAIVLWDPVTLKVKNDTQECHPPQFAALDVNFRNWDRCELQLPKLGIVYNLHRAMYDKSDSVEYNNPTYNLRNNLTFKLNEKDGKNNMVDRITKYLEPGRSGVDFFHVRPSLYSIFRFDNSRRTHFRLRRGGVYIAMYAMFYQPPNKTSHFLSNITTFMEPKFASGMWTLVPHHVLLCGAMFLYPITLLEYSYTQIPFLMKPVVLSFWMISVGIGNFITSFLTIFMFSTEYQNYFFFATIMVFNSLLLFILLCNYIPMVDYFGGDARYPYIPAESDSSQRSQRSQRSGDGDSSYNSGKYDDDDSEGEEANGEKILKSRRKPRLVKFQE